MLETRVNNPKYDGSWFSWFCRDKYSYRHAMLRTYTAPNGRHYDNLEGHLALHFLAKGFPNEIDYYDLLKETKRWYRIWGGVNP